jgi:copper chaperone CopZ
MREKKEVIKVSEIKEKKQESMEITNMTCVGCARTIENELRKFDGIDFSVNFNDRIVTVAYSPEVHKLEDFENAIASHGYKIKEKV